MKPLGKFAQAFVGHRKRKRGGPAATPKPKAAAHNGYSGRPLAPVISAEALIPPPPVTPLQGFYFDYSRQRKRVLNSTHHKQRLTAYHSLRLREFLIIQGTEYVKVNDHFMTDDYLFEIGYVREPGLTPLEGNMRRGNGFSDEYGVYMSLTGKHLYTRIFRDGGFKEEERMVDIAEHVARSLAVDKNNIALTKTFCKESGNIRVLVTVMSRTSIGTSQ